MNISPELRKKYGVWESPKPIVNFIIKAIDEVLIDHLYLHEGIATRKVLLLDVATGKGIFIKEIINYIYQKYYKQRHYMWSNYVDKHLLPMLYGFEIIETNYIKCLYEINETLRATNYTAQEGEDVKAKIYLTNALQNHDDLFGFMHELSNEAKQASRIKKETPVMVAFGNPPYSVSSQNKGEWISGLTQDYKKNLNEKNINPLSDDYIKFIRMSEHYINQTGYGVVAMITNNSFLDGIIHRQMRKHLLETFDTIYIYDLHGNSKKQETAPDGSKDDNVFDIMQGVSISIFVKDGKKNGGLADVLHFDSYGRRKEKYEKLWDSNLDNVGFKKLEYKEPYYFFVPKDFQLTEQYEIGFKINDLFRVFSSGIETGRDELFLGKDKDSLCDRIQNIFGNLEDVELLKKYNIKDTKDFRLKSNFSSTNFNKNYIQKIKVTPFETSYIYYDSSLMRRSFIKTMAHMKNNYGLIAPRIAKGGFNHGIISNIICNRAAGDRFSGAGTYLFPLYLYNQENTLDNKTRTPNLNPQIIKEISQKLNLKFTEDHELEETKNKDNLLPLDLLDYIYAILHSPNYREKYKEFLKIDFPRVPYPENQGTFWQLVDLGGQIRQLHLMEGEKFDGIKALITKYPIAGGNKVETINAKSFVTNPDNPDLGKVYINKEQYFDNVPVIAWQFYIGGYQPAQKWLKDRKERELSHDDILHYQKIILALFETDRLMKEIDQITKLII